MMRIEKKDNLSVRRLHPHEIPAALFVYSRFGRDGAWAAACLEDLCSQGEVWGGFRDGRMLVCGALCPADAANVQSRALQTAFPQAAWHMLPVASLDASAVKAFLRLLEGRMAQLAGTAHWTAILPVKTGECLLPGYLDAGLEVHLVRPLEQLRPHYLLRKTFGRPDLCEVRAFPVRDTYAVSKALENGFAGDKVFWRQDVRWLELYRAQKNF